LTNLATIRKKIAYIISKKEKKLVLFMLKLNPSRYKNGRIYQYFSRQLLIQSFLNLSLYRINLR